MFITIKKKSGELIEKACIDEEVCRLPGFIAINRHPCTVYIAINDISEILVSEEDRDSIYNFVPPVENRQKG